MKNSYKIGDKVEIYGLPDFSADCVYNGQRATIVALPGYNKLAKRAYGLRFDTGPAVGKMEAGVPEYLRPALRPPTHRGDMDDTLSWQEFEANTGIPASRIRLRE